MKWPLLVNCSFQKALKSEPFEKVIDIQGLQAAGSLACISVRLTGVPWERCQCVGLEISFFGNYASGRTLFFDPQFSGKSRFQKGPCSITGPPEKNANAFLELWFWVLLPCNHPWKLAPSIFEKTWFFDKNTKKSLF